MVTGHIEGMRPQINDVVIVLLLPDPSRASVLIARLGPTTRHLLIRSCGPLFCFLPYGAVVSQNRHPNPGSEIFPARLVFRFIRSRSLLRPKRSPDVGPRRRILIWVSVSGFAPSRSEGLSGWGVPYTSGSGSGCSITSSRRTRSLSDNIIDVTM